MGIVRCRLHPQEVTFNTNWTCSWGLDTPTLCVILSGGSESCRVAHKCQCLGSLHLSVVPDYLHYFNWTTECRHQIIGKKHLYLLHKVGLCKPYMLDVWSRIEAKRSILKGFQTPWYLVWLSNSSCQTDCVLYSEYSHPCWDDTVKLLAHWFVVDALQVKRSSIADYVILCTCAVELEFSVWTHLSCCKLC